MHLNGDAKADVVLDATVVVVVVDGATVVDVVITPKIKFCLPASEGLPFTRKSTSGLKQIICLSMHYKCSPLNSISGSYISQITLQLQRTKVF